MAPPLLTINDVTLGFGGKPLFLGISLAVGAGERICLVGRNGSGKSTLLKVLAGQIDTDGGERFAEAGARIAYLPQEPDLSAYSRVIDYLRDAAGADIPEYEFGRYLDALGLQADAQTASLSGGQKRRAAIAAVLAGQPDVLLLDEPTNHLDLPAIEWLENTLAQFRGGMVLISHDREFLRRLSNRTIWLDRGRLHRLNEGFAKFDEWSSALLAAEEAENARRDKLIARESIWAVQGITARRKRNQGRLRKLQALRAARREQIRRPGAMRLQQGEGRLSGRLVIEAEHICKSFGDGRPVIRDFSFRAMRGDKVGIVGPNGAGKTTLVRMLTGDLAPDSGTVRLGTNLAMAVVDQMRSAIDPGLTLIETLTGGEGDQVRIGKETRHVIGYLGDFMFSPEQARARVATLSGGERNRLLLARALATPSNLLVLDEPTNDLDMETLDLLQEFLGDYEGTLLLVSHDRDFLDRVVTSTIVLDGQGGAREYAGGYSDYRAELAAPERADKRHAARKRRPATDKETAERDKTRKPARLSYKHKRALETLPGEIAALEKKIAGLEERLADPTLFAKDREEFSRLSAALEEARQTLDAKQEQWLELEILREEIEGG